MTVVDADESPVVIADDADLRLRQIFPVFQSGLRSSDQPITFLRPDQVQMGWESWSWDYGWVGRCNSELVARLRERKGRGITQPRALA